MAHDIPADGLHRDDDVARCWWAGDDAQYRDYHDGEWGRPVANDTRLFEKMCLEGFQAGLSWLTILRKRENFRAAFHQFDAERVATMTGGDVERLLQDAGIVRHRGKIESTINNARRTLEVTDDLGGLAQLLWRYEPDSTSDSMSVDMPALMARTQVPESKALSKELKRRGFSFVGPTTMYALMQAMGMVNDHLEGCNARPSCDAARSKFTRP